MRCKRLSALLFTLLALLSWACSTGPSYEIIIENGTVVDGTGSPGYPADIAISGGKIAKIGERREVMGMEDRAPAPEELERMKALVREAMENGAFGLSSGLMYLPGRYADTEEVIVHVLVNGRLALENGKMTGETNGAFLRFSGTGN